MNIASAACFVFWLHCVVCKLLNETDEFERFCVERWFLGKNCSNSTTTRHRTKLDALQELNYSNKTLRVVTTLSSYMPFNNKTQNSFTNETIYVGIAFELLNVLVEYFSLQLEYVEPVDDNFGVLVNGSWNGLVGMLVRDEADLAVTGLTITHIRHTVIDFTDPFHFETCGILIRKPEEPTSMFKMVFVFSCEVWLTIAASTIGAVWLIYLLDKAVVPYMQREKWRYKTVDNCSLFVFRMLLQQEGRIYVEEWSHRMFQLGWRYCVLLLAALYVGNLTAVLTTSRIRPPFDDLKGLAEAVNRNEYKICVSKGTAFYAAIQASDTPEYKTFLRFLYNNEKYIADYARCEEILIAEQNVALVNEVTYLTEVSTRHCRQSFDTILLIDRFFPGYFAFGMQKHSYLNSLISLGITEIVESGLVEKWKVKHSELGCKSTFGDAYTTNNKSVNLDNIGGVFIFGIFGIFVGCFALIVERFLFGIRICQKSQVSSIKTETSFCER